MKRVNEETLGHSLRTESLAIKMGLLMKLSFKKINDLKWAARYHDIGKAEVPDEILNKLGKLTSEEFSIMKSHTELGYQLSNGRLDDELRDIIRYHHENQDGSGYFGLKADEIPLGAKIVHVCDVYDALISDRVYKKGWSKEAALAFLVEKKGVMFDANIVNTFVDMIMAEMRVPKTAIAC